MYFFFVVAFDAASAMGSVAIGWQVFTLRHQAFDLGLVGLVLFVPTALLALPAGVFADRHDRKSIVFGCALGEALCAAALAALVIAHVTAIGAYLAVLAIVGTLRALDAPAARSLLIAVVDRERYLSAGAVASGAREILAVGAPALGGALVAIGTSFAFIVVGAIFACGAVVLTFLRTRPLEHDPEAVTLRDAFDGVRYIASRPAVAGAITLDLFAVLFGGVTALLPVFADAVLHVGPIGLGVLRAAPAAGAALVAIALARRPPQRHVGRTLLRTVLVFGIAMALFALSKNMMLSVVALALGGGADMVSVVIRTGIIQLNVPDAVRGRVLAAENVFIGASNELGEFESGMLAALIGAGPAALAGGIGTLVVVAAWALCFPALRKIDRFSDAANAS